MNVRNWTCGRARKVIGQNQTEAVFDIHSGVNVWRIHNLLAVAFGAGVLSNNGSAEK
jgi:hypothetical protein